MFASDIRESRTICARMTPDKFDRNVRSYIMSRIRSRGTKCERTLRAALIRKGIRGFKMHYGITGHPDFAFPVQKVAIFCDSDFWHGRKPIPVSHREYWAAKFRRNMSRDSIVNSKLGATGWTVIRLRESQILKSPSKCVKDILEELKGK